MDPSSDERTPVVPPAPRAAGAGPAPPAGSDARRGGGRGTPRREPGLERALVAALPRDALLVAVVHDRLPAGQVHAVSYTHLTLPTKAYL